MRCKEVSEGYSLRERELVVRSSRRDRQRVRRVASTPDPDTLKKYRDTTPISITILLQKHALLLAESTICTTNLYHDAAPICIAYLCRSIRVRGRWNAPKRERKRQLVAHGVISHNKQRQRRSQELNSR